jgi:hypothetical protein
MTAPSRSFSAALRALVPAPDAPEDAYPPAFRAIAGLILNGVTWHIAGHPHRFTELEFYWNGDNHLDTFTHGDPMQQEFARWYFHRSGSEYRGGTYKGIDLAFGRAGVPAGILVRGARRVDDPPALVDGPCMCVDHLLALTGKPTIQALVAGWDRDADDPDAPLHVTVDPAPRAAAVHASPRVGLTLKRGVLADRARFLARPYRFLSEPAKIKKGRANLVVGLHRDGHDPAEIAALTGSPVAQVERTIADYEAGKSLRPADFTGDLTAAETVRLFGACDALA